MRKILTLLILFPLLVLASESQEIAKNELMWKYAEFTELIKTKNWERITTFESKNTKCGFGPGEEGVGCIKNTIKNNPTCVKKILFSLKQGCKITQNQETISCLSPPQWNDESVILLGARIALSYKIKSKRTLVTHFICGGD